RTGAISRLKLFFRHRGEQLPQRSVFFVFLHLISWLQRYCISIGHQIGEAKNSPRNLREVLAGPLGESIGNMFFCGGGRRGIEGNDFFRFLFISVLAYALAVIIAVTLPFLMM